MGSVSLTSYRLIAIIHGMTAAILIISLLTFIFADVDILSRAWAAESDPPMVTSAVEIPAYKLRVKDHWMANRAIKDLVLLLGGTAESAVLKGSHPQTIRMELSMPHDQTAYFLSKLSGLGELISPSGGLPERPDLPTGGDNRMVLEIFDP